MKAERLNVKRNVKEICQLKMSKREFMLNEFFKRLNNETIKNKSIKYNFLKSVGYVKEEQLIDKDYNDLVNEEINNIKIKKTFKEEIKKEKSKEEEKDKSNESNMKSFLYTLSGFYIISTIIFIYYNYKQKLKIKTELINKLKQEELQRVKSYQYFG